VSWCILRDEGRALVLDELVWYCFTAVKQVGTLGVLPLCVGPWIDRRRLSSPHRILESPMFLSLQDLQNEVVTF